MIEFEFYGIELKFYGSEDFIGSDNELTRFRMFEKSNLLVQNSVREITSSLKDSKKLCDDRHVIIWLERRKVEK